MSFLCESHAKHGRERSQYWTTDLVANHRSVKKLSQRRPLKSRENTSRSPSNDGLLGLLFFHLLTGDLCQDVQFTAPAERQLANS